MIFGYLLAYSCILTKIVIYLKNNMIFTKCATWIHTGSFSWFHKVDPDPQHVYKVYYKVNYNYIIPVNYNTF